MYRVLQRGARAQGLVYNQPALSPPAKQPALLALLQRAERGGLQKDEARVLRALWPNLPADGPPEYALGRAYERSLARPAERGICYSPPAVIEYIVEQTLGHWLKDRTPAETASLRILDPACGAGFFLLCAFRRLLRFHAAAGQPLDPEAVARLFGAHVFGVDLDPVALCVLRLSLRLLVPGVPDLPDLVDLSANLRCGNALIRPGPDVPRSLSMSPGIDFADMRFDVILGNPPYLGGVRERTRYPGPLRAYLRDTYASARGTVDASVLFQELALRLLAPGGLAGLIVPNKFLSAPFGAAFRALALSLAELRLLADFSSARPFPGVYIYPVVYVLCRADPPRPSYPVTLQVVTRKGPAPPRQVIAEPARLDTWSQLFSSDSPLLQRLRALPVVGSRHRVLAAATTSEAYELRRALIDPLEWPPAGAVPGPPESAVPGPPAGPHFRFLTSGLIDRYTHHHGRERVRYLGHWYERPLLPAAARELRPSRRRLYEGEKLIVASMTRRLEVLFDPGGPDGLAPAVPTVVVLPEPGQDLRYLLALLNARLLSWFYRQSFSSLALAGGYMRVGGPQVRALPLRAIDPAEPADRRRAARLIELAAEMAALLAGPDRPAGEALLVAERDREIDALVYELYGLSDAEVRGVEDEA